MLDGKALILRFTLPESRASSTSRPEPPLVLSARGRKPRTLPGTRLRVTPLLSPREVNPKQRPGHPGVYLGLLQAPTGQDAPPHDHGASAELVYLLEGRARVTSGGQELQISPGHALYLPPGVSHSFTVLEDIRALQVYLPAGPEQRFFAAPRKTSRKGTPR